MKKCKKHTVALMATIFLSIILTGTIASANEEDLAILEIPVVAIWDAHAFESEKNAVFYVSLMGQLDEEAEISYCTTIDENDKAEAGMDFTHVCDEVITFAAGEGYLQEKTIAIPLINDTKQEGLETFHLRLESKSDNVQLVRDLARAVIEDDDSSNGVIKIGFTRKEVEVQEEIGILQLEVTLSRPTTEMASVRVKLEGDKEPDQDVILKTNTVEFDVGSQTGTVELEIINDDEPEDDESINVVLHDPKKLRLSVIRKTATVTILDQDKRKSKLYLPVLRSPGKWLAVAENHRPDTDGFNRFYGIAQCNSDSNDYAFTFAGGNNGLYQLKQQDGKGVWVREDDVPESIVNNVVFSDKEKCSMAYAGVLGGSQTNGEAGVWKGEPTFSGENWLWAPEAPLDSEAEESVWALIVYEDLLLVGTRVGLRWKSLADGQQNWNSSALLDGRVSGFSTDDQGKVLATVWDDGVYEAASTEDVKGDKWVKIQGGPEDSKVYQAARNRLGLAAGTQSQLYYKPPEGEWDSSNMGEYEERTYAVLAAKTRMYAGLRLETLLFSDNGGQEWAAMPALPETNKGDAPTFQVRGFHIGTDGMLYVGTSSGVWKWGGSP